ncbi:hypothetical protein NPIL_452191 [Nephila pilipes]|uniref:Uncharacterized protein n=1 Tax=Nephila pilipes TaxID=299642 RepID=A0A8X6UGZ8_NEPPI|nr:hypothetical protein NPIL_452191 [Nephila pilipes]
MLLPLPQLVWGEIPKATSPPPNPITMEKVAGALTAPAQQITYHFYVSLKESFREIIRYYNNYHLQKKKRNITIMKQVILAQEILFSFCPHLDEVLNCRLQFDISQDAAGYYSIKPR